MASILRVNTLTDASSNNSTAMSTIFNGTANVYHTQSYDSQTTYAELRTYGSAHTSLDPSRVNMTVHGDLA